MDDLEANPHEEYVAECKEKAQTMPTTTTTENCTYDPIVDDGESLELWAKRRNPSRSRDLSERTVSPTLEVPGNCEWDLSTACPMQMDSVHHEQ